MSALPKKRPLEDPDPPIADGELVVRCKAGDHEAFGELVRRHQRLACAVAYSTVGDVSTAEDVAQEAFVTAWTTLPKLEDPDKFRPWLAGIARNTARSWRRHRDRHAPRADHGLEVVEGLADSGPSPLERAVSRQDLHIAKEALDKLPPRYREPLVLYYALGESYSLVANALQISEATARQRLSRARKKLSGEVGAIHEAALACGKRAGAAAAVLVVIKSKTAMAAAIASQAKLTTGVSSKSIVALGATGIGAAFVCIAALVVMLNKKDEVPEPPSPAVRRQAVASEVQQPVSPPPRPTPTEANANGTSAPKESAGAPDEAVRGEVMVGKGKVRDRGRALWQRGQPVDLGYQNHRDAQRGQASDAARESERERQRGRVVKHGPAVLAPKDAGIAKPLMRPNLDMRAVERELYDGR